MISRLLTLVFCVSLFPGAVCAHEWSYGGKRISVDFQGADIGNALKAISEISGLNIVIHRDVVGKVNLRVREVPWDQVLDLILRLKGLRKVQEGKIVIIYPL